MSVIIPAYNTAPYIHRAIESSLRQSHKNIEVLVIDDGSTDNTLSIAEEYSRRDSRVRVFHQDNAGVSAARNHGIREAKGEYLMFLDSDDWLEDNAAEVLLEVQYAHPDRLITANRREGSIYCGRYFGILINNEAISSQELNVIETAQSFCKISPAIAGLHNACNKIFITSICREGISFPEGISYAEDAVFMWEYINKLNGAYYVNKSVLNVLQREKSASRSGYKPHHLASLMRAYDLMINNHNNTPEIRKLLYLSYIGFLDGVFLRIALREAVPYSEVKRIRSLIEPLAHDYLSCKSIPLKSKLYLVFDTYLPISLSRLIHRTWRSIKEAYKNLPRSPKASGG